MFYSHTFLARKGPLGTVWCAAHLQHRLRKTHYIATNISSAVDEIMFAKVPIALRLSGHLLLGVVRIYSKKVDYLRQECDVVLIGIRKNFSSSEINLPEGAVCAPVESVTLPERFELDSWHFGKESSYEGHLDGNLRSSEEITLPDQIPVETDPFVTISLDEDPSRSDQPSHPGPEPMDTDIPPYPVDQNTVVQDHGTIIPANSPQVNDVAEIEQRRDAIHDNMMENLSTLLDGGNATMEPAGSVDQANSRKDIASPSTEGIPMPGEQSLPYQKLSNPPSTGGSDMFDSHNSPALVSSELPVRPPPELGIRASPPPEMRNVRRRKRKFDAITVINNRFIKNAIDDPSDICRVRKMRPASALDVWKFNNTLRKENVFYETLTTGVCVDLQNMFKKDFVSMKSRLVIMEEDFSEQSRHPSVPVLDSEPATNYDVRTVNSSEPMPEVAPSTANEFSVPEPQSPVHSAELIRGPESGFLEMAMPSEILPSPHPAPSAGPSVSELNVPSPFPEEQAGVDKTGFSADQNLINSPEAGELGFLEADDITLKGCRGTPGIHALSARSRAVAQYLRGRSPSTKSHLKAAGHSLNEILEGRTRKVCARMFFETLVLKSYGLVDAQQKEAFGDIVLKPTPRLSDGPF